MSRAQGLPPNQDDDHAKYLSLKGACVGVGSMRVLGAILYAVAVLASPLVAAFPVLLRNL